MVDEINRTQNQINCRSHTMEKLPDSRHLQSSPTQNIKVDLTGLIKERERELMEMRQASSNIHQQQEVKLRSELDELKLRFNENVELVCSHKEEISFWKNQVDEMKQKFVITIQQIETNYEKEKEQLKYQIEEKVKENMEEHFVIELRKKENEIRTEYEKDIKDNYIPEMETCVQQEMKSVYMNQMKTEIADNKRHYENLIITEKENMRTQYEKIMADKTTKLQQDFDTQIQSIREKYKGREDRMRQEFMKDHESLLSRCENEANEFIANELQSYHQKMLKDYQAHISSESQKQKKVSDRILKESEDRHKTLQEQLEMKQMKLKESMKVYADLERAFNNQQLLFEQEQEQTKHDILKERERIQQECNETLRIQDTTHKKQVQKIQQESEKHAIEWKGRLQEWKELEYTLKRRLKEEIQIRERSEEELYVTKQQLSDERNKTKRRRKRKKNNFRNVSDNDSTDSSVDNDCREREIRLIKDELCKYKEENQKLLKELRKILIDREKKRDFSKENREDEIRQKYEKKKSKLIQSHKMELQSQQHKMNSHFEQTIKSLRQEVRQLQNNPSCRKQVQSQQQSKSSLSPEKVNNHQLQENNSLREENDQLREMILFMRKEMEGLTHITDSTKTMTKDTSMDIQKLNNNNQINEIQTEKENMNKVTGIENLSNGVDQLYSLINSIWNDINKSKEKKVMGHQDHFDRYRNKEEMVRSPSNYQSHHQHHTNFHECSEDNHERNCGKIHQLRSQLDQKTLELEEISHERHELIELSNQLRTDLLQLQQQKATKRGQNTMYVRNQMNKNTKINSESDSSSCSSSNDTTSTEEEIDEKERYPTSSLITEGEGIKSHSILHQRLYRGQNNGSHACSTNKPIKTSDRITPSQRKSYERLCTIQQQKKKQQQQQDASKGKMFENHECIGAIRNWNIKNDDCMNIDK